MVPTPPSFSFRRPRPCTASTCFLAATSTSGVPQICPRDKEVGSIYDLFHTRNSLHRRAYQHKTCNIVEHMIVEALILANDHISLPGKGGRRVKMSEAIHDMVRVTVAAEEWRRLWCLPRCLPR